MFSTYLLIAVIVNNSGQHMDLELMDTIINRNECLHMAHEFRKQPVFKTIEFKCVKSTESVGPLANAKSAQ